MGLLDALLGGMMGNRSNPSMGGMGAQGQNPLLQIALQMLQQNNQLSAMFADVRRGLTVAAVVHGATVIDTDGTEIDTVEYFGPSGEQAGATEDSDDSVDEADEADEADEVDEVDEADEVDEDSDSIDEADSVDEADDSVDEADEADEADEDEEDSDSVDEVDDESRSADDADGPKDAEAADDTK